MKLEFKYTTELVNNLIKIEGYKEALNSLYPSLTSKDVDRIRYNAKLKKTHFSTSIEGNILSYNQVERTIKNKQDNRIKAEQEVVNYWDALTFLEEEKKKNTPISKEFIYKIHDIIERNGRLKRIEHRGATPPGVLFAVYDSVSHEAEYIPPEYIDIDELLDYMISWYYDNDKLPTPIKAAVMNYAFVTIHPFTDGNGRTSRALASYILMQDSYDFKGFNSLEEYYMMDLDGYYNSLQMNLPALYYMGRENPPHLEIWIEYFTRIMALNAEKIYDMAKEAAEKTRNPILNNLTKRDLALIRYVLENNIEIIKNKELAVLFSVTPRAISKWSVDWVNKGILVPNSGTSRITSYKIGEEYLKLKLSEIGYEE